jgi:hypothetical protein
MTEIEYGVKHVKSNLVFSRGMSKAQAEEWIKVWKSGEGNQDAFVIVYREISQWFTNERDWK